ncbi:MAG TPA: GNAT family N-acetyltransferase [Nocardioidaceae bacterium]|nr:GNAT family N-acetyltransferase [Nocardioidaceae bacterium]
MGITLRPLGEADIPDLARLMAACEAIDDTGEHYNEPDLAEEFANPDIELGKDIVGAYDGSALVGYWSVMPRGDGEGRKVYGFGLTLPDRRGQGIGTTLVETMLARVSELRSTGDPLVSVLTNGVSTNASQAELMKDFGLAPDRWSFSMRVKLGSIPPAPPMPAGYVVRVYAPEDADRWRGAHNIAFADHPNFADWLPSEWDQWVIHSRNFRPDVSFLVTPEGSPETIAAYVQTSEFDAFTEMTGKREAYVGKVGTLPDHRGKGLASALLRHSLVAFQEAGYDESSLDVDSLNPTGALAIYERVGYETERVHVTYTKVFT